MRWRNIGLGAVALGAAAGIWAALHYGNRFLDQFEDTPHDENASGKFFTTSAGWRIHYTVQGEGSPVVLIHGFMDSLQTWRRNAHVLAQTHRVYAIDVLGFGSSDRVRAPIYTLKQQARLLHEFFTAQKIEHAAVIGHSMGGALALQFAYDFPELVHKLVLIAPATYLYAAFPRNGLRRIPRRVSRGVFGLYHKLYGDRTNPLRLAYGDAARITPDAVQIRNQMMHVRGTHDALISMSKSKRESDVPHRLQQVNAPTLLVWGKRDRVVPGWHAERHYHELPNARLAWIETAGHLPHEEEPDSVNELLKEFLDSDQ
ncbi:MAG: alpha/beta hydrolase [Chloroflexi bacterium]|nr:alpha/beta hydrolase [Chloroflexota bacterium]